MNVLSLFDGMSCGQIALNRSRVVYDNYYVCSVYLFVIIANSFVSPSVYPSVCLPLLCSHSQSKFKNPLFKIGKCIWVEFLFKRNRGERTQNANKSDASSHERKFF